MTMTKRTDKNEDARPPAPGERRGRVGGFVRERLNGLGARYALLLVWLAMAVVYGILMPDKFLNVSTVQAIFGSQSALLLLAVASLCTMVVGEFDLSFAGVMGVSATLVPVLVGLHHMNIVLACLIALAAAVVCGAINAFFIVKLGISSLIVTLGTASLYVGIAENIAHSNTVSVFNQTFSNLALTQFLGLPLSFYYGLVACLVFAYVLTWTPMGRHIVFVGANREVARLAGIRVDRVRATSYIVAGFVAGLAGILLVASVGGFDPTASANYLLPALAAVFLGTAIVKPGQFNPMGTFLGIYFLETGIIGLQLLGYAGWVEDVFYGAGLVLAVTAAVLIRSRTKTA
ncbi:monosaccharide ABC transporter membrane protein (CUT2 family) [Antricoccus suffuscus]|uniref:Monosaccharide ABC transporter membrane protein (CUT2 family) n=1 Tax=Antricoccus suffuscus TaxID=1629062 RepID=A0A2T1A5W5_9ACTN|nr:ABC transporter permease [Antricoccus suffuscus]PRZ44002.1 monosaccharide ABC transporter membrane protein (CUT2 family) [Antricoccus suffuscus]